MNLKYFLFLVLILTIPEVSARAGGTKKNTRPATGRNTTHKPTTGSTTTHKPTAGSTTTHKPTTGSTHKPTTGGTTTHNPGSNSGTITNSPGSTSTTPSQNQGSTSTTPSQNQGSSSGTPPYNQGSSSNTASQNQGSSSNTTSDYPENSTTTPYYSGSKSNTTPQNQKPNSTTPPNYSGQSGATTPYYPGTTTPYYPGTTTPYYPGTTTPYYQGSSGTTTPQDEEPDSTTTDDYSQSNGQKAMPGSGIAWKLILLAIGGIASLIVIVLVILYYTKFRYKNAKYQDCTKIDDQARVVMFQLQAHDPVWDYKKIKNFTQELFLNLQVAWTEKDYNKMEASLFKDLYQDWCYKLRIDEENDHWNIKSDVEIQKYQIIKLGGSFDARLRYYTALILAKATNKTVYIESRKVYEEKSGLFTEAWNFEWEKDGWRLKNIDQIDEDFYKRLNGIEIGRVQEV